MAVEAKELKGNQKGSRKGAPKGEARCPGAPSTQEIIAADKVARPQMGALGVLQVPGRSRTSPPIATSSRRSRRKSSTSYGRAPGNLPAAKRTFRRSATIRCTTSALTRSSSPGSARKTFVRTTTPVCIAARSCAPPAARAARASSSAAFTAGAGTSTARTRTSSAIGIFRTSIARSSRCPRPRSRCWAASCSSTWIRLLPR